MRLRVIACEVVAREVYHAAARAGAVVDVTLLTQGLHDLGAERMRERLQAEIDSTDAARYDGIALSYALCSRGTEGIVARDVPIAIPRAHDCITLLLGSRDRYAREFEEHPGTYYFSSGWHERDGDNLAPPERGIPQEMGTDRSYDEYVELYGEENAKYIVEQLRGGLRYYDRLAFIETGLGGEEQARQEAVARARREGWAFEAIRADLGLLTRLLSRQWDEDFVVLAPAERLVATHDERIMARGRCRSG